MGMRQVGMFSVLGGWFVVWCLVLVSLLVNPVWAQATNEDPLAGLPADIVEDPGDEDQIVNSVGPIAVAGCTVADDATVTVEDDGDDTQVELTNGENGVISADTEQVTIVGADRGGNLEDVDQFGTANETVAGTVVRSTGITCDAAGENPGTNRSENEGDGAAGGDEADDQQYADDRKESVIIETVPDKPLPKTGGSPLVFGAGLMLLAATVFGSRVIGRR